MDLLMALILAHALRCLAARPVASMPGIFSVPALPASAYKHQPKHGYGRQKIDPIGAWEYHLTGPDSWQPIHKGTT